jgi:hypothetical protein
MSGASKVTVQKLFLSPTKINETFSKIENILPTLKLKNLKRRISTPPAYLLLSFSAFQQRGEIQITFEPRVEKTLLYINWSLHISNEGFEKSLLSQYHCDKLEEIRVKIVATELPSSTFTDPVPRNNADSTANSQENSRVRINAHKYLCFSCPVCRENFQTPKDLRIHRDKEHKIIKINI